MRIPIAPQARLRGWQHIAHGKSAQPRKTRESRMCLKPAYATAYKLNLRKPIVFGVDIRYRSL